MSRITLVALFAAIIAAGAFIAIPIGPVPIVLQNFFVVLAGLVLGPVMGAASVALYLLAGILGLPVFAGGTAGIARLAGPTGGFLLSYLVVPIIVGVIVGRAKQNEKTPRLRIIIAVVVGFLFMFIPGVPWLKFRLDLDWHRAMLVGFLPFIPGAILKGIAAVLIAPRLRRTAAVFLSGKK